ncbi:thiolase-like protein [Xylariomycetidae sp. FL2044]|nr:thiolase-like protein [Xylariomycetidae sp. FL2044]
MVVGDNSRDILVFSGQGSNQHLSDPRSATKLREILSEDQRSTYTSFLHQCRDAFQAEFESASHDEKSTLGRDVQLVFNDSNLLLIPPQSLQSHPVLEAISLYTRQVLELLVYQSRWGNHHLVEASGICTGVLPAALAASFVSYDSPDFVRSAVPPSRFEMPRSDEKPSQPSASYYGNFLSDTFDFDGAYFNISPRESKSMDPQQRLLLRAALESLEDAGYAPNSTPSSQTRNIGVYIGAATCDYVDNLRDNVDVYYSPGTLRAFLSGRISYAFKFAGPSMVIDTACSSSIVSIYHACMALKSGDCTMALAGGVNTISSPDMYRGLFRAHFLSPTGQCKPFDESADGYCRSEGCGMVVLKRLSAAVEEGDHVYGVIRGVGVNQCGTAKSITHPDSRTQAVLMKSVLDSARVSASSVNFIEAHGTGMQAGDVAEFNSIASVFGSHDSQDPIFVGSLKGNIGHSEAASGVASLAKLLLMMEKKEVPPQASFQTLNPGLRPGLLHHGLTIPTQMQPWNKVSGQSPRRALLNNFGAAGSNAALLLEEFVPPRRHGGGVHQRRPRRPKRSHDILNLSAKTSQGLETLRQSYASYLEINPDVPLEDLCYTANARRQEYWPYRTSIVGSSSSDLLDQLRLPLEKQFQSSPDHTYKTVFVFSGQGSIYPGVGADLLSTNHVFRAAVDRCDEVLLDNSFPAVKPLLNDSQVDSSSQTTEESIILTQCACFVLEYALALMWKDWGLQPDVVVGHSIGEYAAFAIAGSLGLEEALIMLANRARLMSKHCSPQSTGMVAARLSASDFDIMRADNADSLGDISVACFNSPGDLVLAGPPVSLAKLVQRCKGRGIRHKRLDVLFGFHSPAMDPILEDFAGCSRAVSVCRPSVRTGP